MDFHMKYDVPKEILEKIPDGFWKAFSEELTKVFGSVVFEKDENGTYGIVYVAGTFGWVRALKSTCKQLGCDWLWEYWDGLEWWESDMFDDMLEEWTLYQAKG